MERRRGRREVVEVGWRWWSEAGDQAQVGAFLLAGTDCPSAFHQGSLQRACCRDQRPLSAYATARCTL